MKIQPTKSFLMNQMHETLTEDFQNHFVNVSSGTGLHNFEVSLVVYRNTRRSLHNTKNYSQLSKDETSRNSLPPGKCTLIGYPIQIDQTLKHIWK